MLPITVIIPNYNNARYISMAIESVLAQTQSCQEILVIDDCSTDNSLEIIEKYRQDVNIFRLDVNKGPSYSRNQGISQAKAEFVAFLDADDIWDAAYLERMHQAIDKSDVAAVYCGCRYIDPSSIPTGRIINHIVAPEDLYHELLRNAWISPSHVIVRRNILRELGGFDIDFRMNEDYDLWLRIAKSYKMVGIEDVLVGYRRIPNSLSSNFSSMIGYAWKLAEKHTGPLPEHVSDYSYNQRLISVNINNYTINSSIERSDLESAIKAFINVIAINPRVICEEGFWYTLAFSYIPDEFRGQIKYINLDNSKQIITLFTDIFKTHVSDAALVKRVIGRSTFALGLLAYNSFNKKIARDFFISAVNHDPSILTEPVFLHDLLVCMIPESIVKKISSKYG